ncbi:MAG: potassium transporter TrkA, partial [Eubacterium sp.]
MTLNSAVFTLLVFIALYLSIIEIFSVLFIITGMPEARARFQVISMLTNSGFTTKESEAIVTVKKRRILAQLTMLFGYTFTVIGVSMILNVILKIPQSSTNEMFIASAYLVIFLIILFTFKRL